MLPGWDEHDRDFCAAHAWTPPFRAGNCVADLSTRETGLLCYYVIEKSQAWIIFLIHTLVVAALSLHRITVTVIERLIASESLVWFPTGSDLKTRHNVQEYSCLDSRGRLNTLNVGPSTLGHKSFTGEEIFG